MRADELRETLINVVKILFSTDGATREFENFGYEIEGNELKLFATRSIFEDREWHDISRRVYKIPSLTGGIGEIVSELVTLKHEMVHEMVGHYLNMLKYEK